MLDKQMKKEKIISLVSAIVPVLFLVLIPEPPKMFCFLSGVFLGFPLTFWIVLDSLYE